MTNEAVDKIIYSMSRVTKRHGQKEVLKDISLSYFYGAKIGVLGVNGSGKSSLLKILAGVAKSIHNVLIPKQNTKDLEEIPKELLRKIKVYPIAHIDEALPLLFGKQYGKVTVQPVSIRSIHLNDKEDSQKVSKETSTQKQTTSKKVTAKKTTRSSTSKKTAQDKKKK